MIPYGAKCNVIPIGYQSGDPYKLRIDCLAGKEGDLTFCRMPQFANTGLLCVVYSLNIELNIFCYIIYMSCKLKSQDRFILARPTSYEFPMRCFISCLTRLSDDGNSRSQYWHTYTGGTSITHTRHVT